MKYFSNLEFYPDDTHLGVRVQTRRHLWAVISYLLLSFGILARQMVDFPKVRLMTAGLSWSVLIASLIVGLAIFPPAMRWLNSRRKQPGLEHIVTPFTIGFFLDLSLKVITKSFFA